MDAARILNNANTRFEKIINLKINEKYKIDYFEKSEGKYGTQLVVHIEDFKLSLPPRYNKYISKINELNKNPPSLIYKGKKQFNDKEMHDIEFI